MVLVVYLGREVRMRVQRVLMPDGSESWTVLDVGGEPVGAVEAFLAHLQALDRSPTTLRTYATTLKLWLQFLEPLGVAVDEATVENVPRFVTWLRAPAENVAVLDGGSGRCCAATVNRHLICSYFLSSGQGEAASGRGAGRRLCCDSLADLRVCVSLATRGQTDMRGLGTAGRAVRLERVRVSSIERRLGM
jgi:hypothetical protein